MSLVLEIKVIPSSGRQKIVLEQENLLKCYLKSAPEGGKANIELIKYLSKQLNITRNSITIISGATSRKKRINVDCPLTFEQLCKKLGLKNQT